MKALKLEGRTITLIELDSTNTETELKAMQQAVGGYIECVTIAEDAALLVDEEGLLKALSQNALASLVARRQIVGTALLVGIDGERFCDPPERYVKNLLLLGT